VPSDYGLVPSKALRRGVPGYTEKPDPGFQSFQLAIDWGGRWLDLNDKLNYEVGGEFMSQSSVTWRKVQVTSPVTEGSYTVHAVREMVTEQVQLYVRGANQFEMQLNIKRLEELFGRLDYRLRLDFDDYRETWSCQTAEYTYERSRVYAHNGMAVFTASVPRFPTVAVERIV
jgi:hypothetical protein